jgi:SPP1 family phage portal protein
MFYLNKGAELTTELLQKIMSKYSTNTLPKLKRYWNYYNGKHDIVNKQYTDETKQCNRIVTNFAKIIADTYTGYICGKPVSYASNDTIDDVQEVINYNDDNAANIAWIRNALIFGIGYELQWIDKFGQVRYTPIDPRNCFAIYDNTLNADLQYFVRWYDADNLDETETYMVEVYSAYDVKYYRTTGLGGSLEFMGGEPHYFKDVPASVFPLNDEMESIFASVMSLNDAYNELQSAEIDDFQAWVDCYLRFTGVDAEPEDLAEMKKNRVLIMPENATADWLTKNTNDTQIVNMLENIKENIFKVSACPDMADDNFMAQSGTALAYKLVGFENVASSIVARFTKAIQRRIELICNILNLKASDAIWRDIRISFVRNIPVNLTETINLVNALKGTVSDATLLAQIPFIDDVQAELEAVQAQKQANMDLYGFGAFGAGSEEETETTEGEE